MMTSDYGHPITAAHTSRQAIVYVRQSTTKQLEEHRESTQLQRDLRQKAIELGWPTPVVVDDDLGISAGGYAERPGFQKLLARVAMREVGIILCIDASRLSRNSKDWAHLFELCRYFGTLIGDVDQIYDLSRPNDRLIIGIKGTVSEMELGLIRNRLRSGAEAKTARGELKMLLPAGYVYDADDNVVFDPDRRVQAAIATMFDQFERCSSIRQLGMWYRDTKTRFPSKALRRQQPAQWTMPTSNTLRKLLLHPIYAGIYVYGRRSTIVEYVDGKLVKRETEPRKPEEARVCIHDHHPAYISWERYLANRDKIFENRARWSMQENRGAIREGLALLTGLLRCARCGSRIYVNYKKDCALYSCDGGNEQGSKRCQSFGSSLIDQRVSQELCRALQPHAIDASLRASEAADAQHAQEIENVRLQVEAAQYQADRAFEQFDLCDPKNRLVADTLEEHLNGKLAELAEAKQRYRAIAEREEPCYEHRRTRLHQLASDFPALWHHPDADPKLKKRILRAAIHEILVQPCELDCKLEITIHWQGGDHTQTFVKRPSRRTRKAHDSLEELVPELAQGTTDPEIARILNMKKLTTPGGLPWTKDRVRDFRRQHRIRCGPQHPPEDTMTLNQVQAYLGVGHNGALALVRRGLLDPNQVTDFAPWRVRREQLDSDEVQSAVRVLKATGRLPKGGSPQTQPGLFDADKGLTSEVKKGAL